MGLTGGAGTCELVAERIEAVVAPALSYGPGVDAVGSPQMGSLEVGYKEYLPHAQAVVTGLVKMGFYNIFIVCHHQGEGGQQALCMKLVAANLSLGVPNAEHPHWWGVLSPDDDRPRAPSIQVLAAQAGRTLEQEFAHVGHGNFYETSAILGLYPSAVDLSELESGRRDDTPWFGKHKFADGAGMNAGKSAKDATEDFGTALVDAWAGSLAAEILERSGLPVPDNLTDLKRGDAQPSPGRRIHCPRAQQLDQMRPGQIQDAAARGVPILLPIGVLENHGYHLPCGVDLVCARAICELAAELTEAIVAPPLSYGPGVDAVGPPSMGSLEVGYEEYLAHAQVVLRGLVAMGFTNIFAVCQHQGAGGQIWLATELAAAHLWIETPNIVRPHWWGQLPPEQQPAAPTIAVLSTIPANRLEDKYIGGDHAGFWETSAILGVAELAADLSELEREDTPWFAAGEPWHRPTIPEGGASWGKEMVGAWARALADEVAVRCGNPPSTEEVDARLSRIAAGRSTTKDGAERRSKL